MHRQWRAEWYITLIGSSFLAPHQHTFSFFPPPFPENTKEVFAGSCVMIGFALLWRLVTPCKWPRSAGRLGVCAFSTPPPLPLCSASTSKDCERVNSYRPKCVFHISIVRTHGSGSFGSWFCFRYWLNATDLTPRAHLVSSGGSAAGSALGMC